VRLLLCSNFLYQRIANQKACHNNSPLLHAVFGAFFMHKNPMLGKTRCFRPVLHEKVQSGETKKQNLKRGGQYAEKKEDRAGASLRGAAFDHRRASCLQRLSGAEAAERRFALRFGGCGSFAREKRVVL
jgi:hypothetical protein